MRPHVYVEDNAYGGINHYRVFVDHVVYDEFVSTCSLSWAKQDDVAGYYADALEHYEKA